MSSRADGKTPRVLHTPAVDLSWADSDRHRWLTQLALAGLIVGILLAVVGLPPVEVHGPLHQLGIMAPTCGATRAVRLALLGDLSGALSYNPLGPALVAGATAALGRHLLGLRTGRWLTFRVPRARVTVLLSAVAVILLEVNQQLHADVLMSSR